MKTIELRFAIAALELGGLGLGRVAMAVERAEQRPVPVELVGWL